MVIKMDEKYKKAAAFEIMFEIKVIQLTTMPYILGCPPTLLLHHVFESPT